MATFVEKKLQSNFVVRTPATQKPQTSALARLNDPYQLNTVLDVLFNTAGLKKAYGNASLTSRLKAVRDISLNQYIRPALKGDFATVGMNTLIGLGETLDVFGNITKGLAANKIDKTANVDYEFAKQAIDLIDNKQAYINEQRSGETTYTFFINGKPQVLTSKEVDMYRNLVNSGNTVNISKLTTSERLKASIGIGEYGRINFQANQGNIFSDIALEILLDPETWVTLGRSAFSEVVKKGADKGLRLFAKQLDDIILNVEDVAMREELRQLSVNLTEDVVRKNLATKLTRAFSSGKTSIMTLDYNTNTFLKTLVGDAVKSDTVRSTYKLKTIQDAVNAALLATGNSATALDQTVVQEALQRSMTKHVNKMTTTILSVVNGSGKVIDKTQSILLKSALTPSGVFPVWAIAQKAPAVARYIRHILQSADELYTNEFGNRKITSYFEGAYNKERTTQTITDGLPDRLKALYREPEYIRAHERSAIADMTFIDAWYRRLDNNKLEEQIAEIDKYIRTAQDTDIESLIEYVDAIVKNAAQSSSVLKTYRDVLQKLNDNINQLYKAALQEKEINVVRASIKALDTVLDIKYLNEFSAESLMRASKPSTTVSNFLTPFVQSIDSALDNYDGVYTRLQFETDMHSIQEELLNQISFALDPLLDLSTEIKAFAEMAYGNYVGVFEEQLKDMLDSFDIIANGIPLVDTMQQTLALQHILQKEQATLTYITELNKVTRALEHNLSDIINKVDTVSSFVDRPTNVFDGIQQIKQSNSARMQAIIKKLDMRGTQKSSASTLTEAERIKFEAMQKKVYELAMPASLLPTGHGQEQMDNVLDVIERLTKGGRSDSLGLFIRSADEIDLSVPQDKLMQYTFENFQNKMLDLMYTSTLSAEYASVYNEVTNMLNNLLTSITRTFPKYKKKVLIIGNEPLRYINIIPAEDKVLKSNIKIIEDFLDDLQTYCLPTKIDVKKDLIESYEATFKVKQESFTSLLNIMNDDTVNAVIDNIRNGPFGEIVRDVIGNNLYSEEVRNNAQTVLNLINSFESTRNFMYHVLMSDLRPEVRESLVASVMNYWYVDPVSFKEHQSFWADRIVERMPNYTQYTQQSMRRHNLNKLMQDEEFKEAIKQMYSLASEKMPDNELHQALSDAIAAAGVLRKLAENNRDLANTIRDKVIVHIDSEAMNATVRASTNRAHQIAFVVTKNDEVLGKYSQALHPSAIMGESGYDYLPDYGYMFGLYDMAQHSTDGVYAPLADYTEQSAENMRDFYLKHISEGNTAEAATSEDMLILDTLYDLYKQLTKHATYNPETKTFDAILSGHNIKGFDYTYLKSICSSRKLYEKAANDPRYGFDLHFFDNLEIIDTLEQVKIEDFAYVLTSAEENTIRGLLFEYADSLEGNTSAKLFTAFNTADIRRINNLITSIQDNPGIALKPYAGDAKIPVNYVFSDLIQQLAAARKVVVDIFVNNKVLADRSYYASTVTDVKFRDYWLKFFQNELGMDDLEIARRFGKDASNLQLTSLFAAAGEYSDYAYKPILQPQKQDAWWIGTLTRTQAGDFTNAEAAAQSKIIAALESYQKEVKNTALYASYYNEMKDAVYAILDTGDFNHMRYIRTEGLNVTQQYALFRYLTNKIDPDNLPTVLQTRLLPKQVTSLINLLKISRKFSDVSADRYLTMFNGKEQQTTLAYLAMLDDVMALRKQFEDMSHWQDANGLIGSAATLQIKAMEPIYNIVDELTTNLKAIDPIERVKFYNKEIDLTNELSRQVTKRFTNSTPEGMLKWLAHNHAHVVLDMYSFRTVAEYDEFIARISSSAYTDLGIHSVVSGAEVWVYLPRNTNLRVHKIFDTGEKVVVVNGRTIDKYEHPAFQAIDMAETYNGFISPETLQRGMDAIDFMTEGASRGSTYEMYGQNTFRKIYNQMPEEMQKEFYTLEELSGPLFWDSTPYNFSILGTLTNKRKFGIGTSGQFVSSLRNATEYRMNEHGMRLVYTQAMFNEATALQNTAIGEAIINDTEAVLRYFKDNPDYTIAMLVSDKRSKWGYRVQECDVTSKLGLRDALANNGRVMTYSEYEKLYEVINNNVVSETKMSAWQKIVRMFKIGYLVNPGTWSRNAIDAFLKNVQATNSSMVEAYATAFKDIKNYDDIVRQLNGLGGGHFPLPGVVKRFFEGGQNTMDYDSFMRLHAFFSDPAAGSEARLYTELNAKSREKYLTQLLQAGQITTDEYHNQMTRQTFNQITNNLLAPMNYVERVSRLAAYNQLTKQGYTNNTALRLVEKTHFAYSTKSPTEQTLELLIPFYTFTSRNFAYWMEAIENNPAYFALMRDVLEPALNLEQYSPEELESNGSVQRNVLSGNINVVDDYYWSLNLSFMDALKWLTNPIEQTKGALFSPAQAVINVFLQGASDEAYRSGKAMLSNWLQNTFNLKMTEEEIRAKYQSWADEYMRLYEFKVSKETPIDMLTKKEALIALIPLVGSQIQRMMTTGVYFDDGDGMKAHLYMLGLAGKAYRWEHGPSQETRDLNIALYQLCVSDPANWNKFNQLAKVLGYDKLSMKEMPNPIKQTIYAMLTGQVPDYNVIPVLQDDSAMRFMWNALRVKYDVNSVAFEDIPKETLQTMYGEIAESTITIANIYDMLDKDELSRISYSVVKKNLGLTDLKIYQLPLEALDVIEAAMKAHLYASVRTPRTASGTSGYRRYPKKTYTGAESPGHFGGYSGVTPYDTDKGVYANYGHNWAQKRSHHNYLDFYRDLYTSTGASKMRLNMYRISPENFKYRLKDQFYYYR